MSAALVSMQARQNRLTSLLNHLTVDPGASARGEIGTMKRVEGRYSN